MKQKVVINISMNGKKSRTKALQIVVGASGVESAALKGDNKSQIEVIGDGVDAVSLATSLRKKVGYAELVTVSPAEKEEKKAKESETEVQPVVWTYQAGMPHYDYVVTADRYSQPYNCSIL